MASAGMAKAATIEIRVRDGDDENSILVPLRDMPARWGDAHRIRHEWTDDDPLATMAINYLRGMARDDLIPRTLPECTAVVALALLCEVVDEKKIASMSAALAVPNTVLEICFACAEMPVYRVWLAEIGEATRH